LPQQVQINTSASVMVPRLVDDLWITKLNDSSDLNFSKSGCFAARNANRRAIRLADGLVQQRAFLYESWSAFTLQLSNVQDGPSTMSFFEAILFGSEKG
jgi:hypothetical protein